MLVNQSYGTQVMSDTSTGISVRGRFLASDGIERIGSMLMESSKSIYVSVGDPSYHPKVGEKVICNIESIGITTGDIAKITTSGFMINIQMSAARHERINERLNWLRNRTDSTPEQRISQRITPIRTSVIVRTDNTNELQGEIIDISMSGAAVTLSVKPEIGTKITIGKRFANVVRHLDDGIAAKFVLPFTLETFNEHVVL